MINSKIEQIIAEFKLKQYSAEYLLVKIRSRKVVDGDNLRKIYRNQWKGLKCLEDLIGAINILEKDNICWIEEVKQEFGRPFLVIRIQNNEFNKLY